MQPCDLTNQAVQRAAAMAADKIQAGLKAARIRARRGPGSGYSTSIASAFAAGIGAISGHHVRLVRSRGEAHEISPRGSCCLAASQTLTEAGQRQRSSIDPGAGAAGAAGGALATAFGGRAASPVSDGAGGPGPVRPSERFALLRERRVVDPSRRGAFVDAFKPRFSDDGSGQASRHWQQAGRSSFADEVRRSLGRSSFVDACYDHTVRGPTRALSPNLDPSHTRASLAARWRPPRG